MMAYAVNTKVPTDRTRLEIEALLRKAGAFRIVHVDEPELGTVMFFLQDRMYKLTIALPRPEKEQQRRSKWRSLLLIIKAKLEVAQQQATTIEQEFFPHVVMPNSQTFYEFAAPAIADAYKTGLMPTEVSLLLEGPRGSKP